MDILKPIKLAYQKASEKGWDKIYWAIDLHGTIAEGHYSSENLKPDYYPLVKETLQLLSKEEHIVLILYTCSYLNEAKEVLKFMEEDNIKFDYINKNPEAEDTKYGTYKDKPYFNVLLEDKAGFEPDTDWEIIYNYLQENIENLKSKLC